MIQSSRAKGKEHEKYGGKYKDIGILGFVLSRMIATTIRFYPS